MRRGLQRANEELGTSWTLHQVRHTYVITPPVDPLRDVRLGCPQLRAS
jgi:hypothetical protein